MGRISWERLAALCGAAFVVLYVVAFSLGIEVGASDREILDYYASSSNRRNEIVAFFCIAGAALALIVFAAALRNIIVRAERVRSTLASLALAGGIAGGTLILAGNALSRATALASTDEEFVLDPNTRRLFENAGFLLFASATLAAIVLVVAVSIAALRLRVLPNWLGWTGFAVAVLLPLGIVFVGFLVFAAWLIAASIALAVRPVREADQVPVPRES